MPAVARSVRGLMVALLITTLVASVGPAPAAAQNAPPGYIGGGSEGEVPEQLGALPTGARVVVTETKGFGANLRRAPRADSQLVRVVPEGEVLEVAGADKAVDGLVWRNVRDSQGNLG